jgi:membrane protein
LSQISSESLARALLNRSGMGLPILEGISRHGVYDKSWREFFRTLKEEIKQDYVFNGAAALAYYLMLAIFPAMIFLLNLLPYLPVPDIHGEIMALLHQMLPGETARFFTGTVQELVSDSRESLLSAGAVLTLWAASSGMHAIMNQLNITYDVEEGRSWLRARGTAVALTVSFGALVIGSFILILLGEALENWLSRSLGWSGPWLALFAVLRWLIILAAFCLAFAIIYFFGPDVEQDFKFITPGSLLGVILLVTVSLLFRAYVDNFGNYNKTYGSIGAVIVLMLWLYNSGLMILLGSEVNALIEHFSPDGKNKGEKDEGVPAPKRPPPPESRAKSKRGVPKYRPLTQT